jgi:hypothetical protein
VPYLDPRFEQQQLFLQAVKEIAMQRHKTWLRNWMLWALPVTAFFAVNLMHSTPALAQEELAGIEQGNYNIKQSVEFGYRFVDNTGDLGTYDTFVNLQQGPRLLDFSTEMRSLDHHGTLFDRLYFMNFGYGGDPQNVSRLRIEKNRWYDFTAMFRRDENYWNYSLQANPLNPVVPPFANAPAGFTPIISTSPHLWSTRRKLQDFDLLLMPQSRVRFHAGYSRSNSDGPAFTTIHQGTEQLLFSQIATVQNTYRFGVDFRVLPKTNISYDQIFNFYKDDTGTTDQNQLFSLSNGVPVDIGVSLNAGANQPCASTFLPSGFVNPTCSAYFDYLRHGRTRTNAPTEQFSMQSSYIPRVDFSARVSYTSGSAVVSNWLENWTGRESRTAARNQFLNGSIGGERVNATADFGVTMRLTDRLSFIDSFHYGNFHNPMQFDSSTCFFFSPNLLTPAHVFTPISSVNYPCAPPVDGVAGTPAHSTSSAADFALGISSLFLKQSEKTNLAQLQYQFSNKLGLRIGFRDRRRSIDDKDFETVQELFLPNNANRGDCALVGGLLQTGCTANGDGSFTFITPDPGLDTSSVEINEYSGLFGIWARPLSNWRVSFDTELMSADNTYTRISPRQSQEYRIRSTYKVSSWLSLNESITIWEARNNVPEINNLQHNRSYGFSAAIQPRESFGFELGYDYNDVFSQILICYTSSVAPPGLNKCPGSTLVQQLSVYTNNSNFGHFDFNWKPVKRLTTRFGANLTGTSGSVLIISPNAPSGPLDSKFLQPYAGFDVGFTKNWTGKAYWAYHGYHEDADLIVPQDFFAPRNFHANLVTLSLRYAF